MSWVLFSFSTQGAGWRELGAVKSKHMPEACLYNMASGTGWEGKLVPIGLCILLRGMTNEFVAKVCEDLLQSHLGWATGKTYRLWIETKISIQQYKNFFLWVIIVCHEAKKPTSSNGNFTGVIALTQAAGSKGGASLGEMCMEPSAGHTQEGKI